jgi:hypothetical protein
MHNILKKKKYIIYFLIFITNVFIKWLEKEIYFISFDVFDNLYCIVFIKY